MEELYERLNRAVSDRLVRFRSAALMVKIFMIIVASAIVGVAQFAQILLNGEVQWWSVVGLVAAIIAGFGGVILANSEDDASNELKIAHDATKAANDARRVALGAIEESDELVDEIISANNLYQAVMLMRAIVERAAFKRKVDVKQALDDLLEVATRPLMAAANFRPDTVWTMCIYQVVEIDGVRTLEIVSHARAIRCDIKDARKWPIGKGVGGVALANAAEVVVPDLLDPALGTIFGGQDGISENDRERYQSMAAVPITLGPDQDVLWGMAIGTIDAGGHFSVTRGQAGPTEAIRALAGMCSLAVVTTENNVTISAASQTGA